MLESRPYQERIHEKVMGLIDDHDAETCNTILLESATGSGKTIMGLRILKELAARGMKIGWIAHRKELLSQAARANQDYFGIEDIRFISLFDRNPNQYSDIDIICIDESQHDATRSAAVLHEAIKPEVILGLSATPYRVDNAKLCFQHVVRDAGMRQLIMENWLAQFNQYIIDDVWSPENVADTYCMQPEVWGKTVIYFLTIKAAKKCNRLLNESGIISACITGTSPRGKILDSFASGEIQVLTNVLVLTEGFDSPDLRSVFVRPGSKAPTIQMSGRAFRKHPDTPVVNVVQSGDTRFPFSRHARPQEQWVLQEGKWRRVDIKNLHSIIATQRQKIAKAEFSVPSFLKKAHPRGGHGIDAGALDAATTEAAENAELRELEIEHQTKEKMKGIENVKQIS